METGRTRLRDLQLGIHFFLQLAVILAACRVVGWLSQRLGQPAVVGEMIAGVLLGPSVFGAFAPGAEAWLFPRTLDIGGEAIRHPSMSILHAISQLGIVLYMFLVGLRFDHHQLKEHRLAAVTVAISGLLVPFALGGGLAIALEGRLDLFSPHVSPAASALFLGAAMCITAFPLLARLLTDRGIADKPVGTLTLAAGAVNDAAAWVLLAIVLSASGGAWQIAALAIGGGAGFAVLMMLAGRRLLKPLGDREVTAVSVGIALTALIAGAWVTDVVGIHAIFGAFVVGVAMPRGKFADQISARATDITAVLLVPVFFAYSGLNTELTLLANGGLWLVALAVCLVAIIGKGAGCMLGARLGGEGWRDSAAIGSLMNARGLMELVVANIGLERGVITPALYSILILMAVLTTLMASPLYDFFTKPERDPA